MRYTYQHNGRTYQLNMDKQADGQYTATLDGRTLPVQVKPLANGGWRITLDGQSHTVHSLAQSNHRFVQLDGASYTFTVPAARLTRRPSLHTGSELTAQMPGQVTAIMMHAGDIAARGQTVLILEAMKMEMRVVAPADGLIEQILVQVGQVVERGQQLAVFKPAD